MITINPIRNERTVCGVSLAADCFLAFFKLIFARISGSAALISDAAHSCADVCIGFFTLGSVILKKKRGIRAEKTALCVIAAALALTGAAIITSSIMRIVTGAAFVSVSLTALPAQAFAAAVKEILAVYSSYASKKLTSPVLYALSRHHHGDVISTLGSFAGIAAAYFAFPVLDAVTGIITGILIIKTGADVMRNG